MGSQGKTNMKKCTFHALTFSFVSESVWERTVYYISDKLRASAAHPNFCTWKVSESLKTLKVCTILCDFQAVCSHELSRCSILPHFNSARKKGNTLRESPVQNLLCYVEFKKLEIWRLKADLTWIKELTLVSWNQLGLKEQNQKTKSYKKRVQH